MASKTRQGTGNLLQDLVCSVVRLKKCDDLLNSRKVQSNLTFKSANCYICHISGMKQELRAITELEFETLLNIICLTETLPVDKFYCICPMCSEMLVKLLNLKAEIDKISTCIRSLVQLRGKQLDILDGNESGTNSGCELSGDVAEVDSIKLSTSLDNVAVDDDNVAEFVESPPNESLHPDEGDFMSTNPLARDGEEGPSLSIILSDIDDDDIKVFTTPADSEVDDNMFPNFDPYADSESTSLSNQRELVQTSRKRSRSNSNVSDKEVALRDAKRPRASRIRAEGLIKNLSTRDNENDENDDIDNREDADFHDSSISSEDESDYCENDNSSQAPPDPEVGLDVAAPLSREPKQYSCRKCKRHFKLKSQFVCHKRNALAHATRKIFGPDGKVIFVCDLCQDLAPFSNKVELVLHMKNTHWKPITCQPCNKTFPRMRSYNIHLLSNTHAKTVGEEAEAALEKKKKFKCSKCDKTYAAEFQLLAHIRSAHNPSSFICGTCGKPCRNLDVLTIHQNTHEAKEIRDRLKLLNVKEKAFPCELCHQGFTSRQTRYKHVRSFHKRIRHKCDLCLNDFATRSGLNRHKDTAHNLKTDRPPRTREKTPPVQCDICLKTMHKISLVGHMELVHFQHKSKCPFECCDVEFGTEQEWIQHLEGCTSEKITKASLCSCVFCGAVFRHLLLKIFHHLHAHKTFTCEICSKVFTKQAILNLHKYSHEESKPHLCPKCGKRFKQSWNLKLHTTTVCGDDDEEKQKMIKKRKEQYKSFREKLNFKCDECSVRCTTAIKLKLHKNQVHCDTKVII